MNANPLIHVSALIACLIGPAVAVAQDGEGEAGGPPQPQGPPPALVRVAPVQRQVVREHRQVVGQIAPVRRSLVASEETGHVVQAPPDVGTAVSDNQVLAKIDDELLRIELTSATTAVRRAEADLAEREAELTLARRNARRLKELMANNVAKQKEVDDAADEARAAAARREAARALLDSRRSDVHRIEYRLGKLTIKAPFAASVVSKHTEVGQWLNPGAPVAEVIAINQVDAVLNVPETMLPHLAPEAKFPLHIDALDATREGVVYRLVPEGDRQARTFPALIRLDNPEHTLKPGMTVRAMLPTGREAEALTVPRDAVQMTPTGARVMANRGGAAVPVPVRIRFGIDARFVIDGELREGETVVIEGNERLFPGQPLKLMSAGGPPQREAGTAAPPTDQPKSQKPEKPETPAS